MSNVFSKSKPDALWPLGREGAVHEAISNLWTACGKMIGADWYETKEGVECKACLRKVYRIKTEAEAK